MIVTIKGKEFGFKFSILCFRLYSESKGIEFHEVYTQLQKDSIYALNELLIHAHKVHTRGDVELSVFDIDELIEDMEQKDLKKLYKEYNDSVENHFTRLGIKLDKEKEPTKKK